MKEYIGLLKFRRLKSTVFIRIRMLVVRILLGAQIKLRGYG